MFRVCHSPTAPYFGNTRTLELHFETSLKKVTGEGTSVGIRSWFTLARPTLHVAYKLYEKAGRGFPTGPWKSSYLFHRNAVVFLHSIALPSLASDFLPQSSHPLLPPTYFSRQPRAIQGGLESILVGLLSAGCTLGLCHVKHQF